MPHQKHSFFEQKFVVKRVAPTSVWHSLNLVGGRILDAECRMLLIPHPKVEIFQLHFWSYFLSPKEWRRESSLVWHTLRQFVGAKVAQELEADKLAPTVVFGVAYLRQFVVAKVTQEFDDSAKIQH